MAGRKLPKGYRRAATALDSSARVTFTGPLFAPDADKTLRENIRRMLQGMADDAAHTAAARSPRHTGAFAAGIKGRTQGVKGNKWALTAVVSQTHVYPWKNKGARGFSGRSEAEYRGGKVEARYRIFRSVTYQMRRMRAGVAEEIIKGLA